MSRRRDHSNGGSIHFAWTPTEWAECTVRPDKQDLCGPVSTSTDLFAVACNRNRLAAAVALGKGPAGLGWMPAPSCPQEWGQSRGSHSPDSNHNSDGMAKGHLKCIVFLDFASCLWAENMSPERVQRVTWPLGCDFLSPEASTHMSSEKRHPRPRPKMLGSMSNEYCYSVRLSRLAQVRQRLGVWERKIIMGWIHDYCT